MTKKDYINFAKLIKKWEKEADLIAVERVINEIADIFQNDNPRFDYRRFVEYIKEKA